MSEANPSFESVKTRLDEIVDAVNAQDISLDDALDLYEEAVKLGIQASTLLEEGAAEPPAETDESFGLAEPDEEAVGAHAATAEIGIGQTESTDVGHESVAAGKGEDGVSLQQ